MDKEVFKIKEKRGQIDGRPQEMDPISREKLARTINIRFSEIYYKISKEKIDNKDELINIDQEEIIKKVAESMVDILETFADINVYPDYFWRIIMEMNVVLKKVTIGKNEADLTSDEQNIVNAHNNYLFNKIRSCICLTNDGNSMNVNDCFVELASFYSVFKLKPDNNELLSSSKYLYNFLFKCFKYNDDFVTYAVDSVDDVKYMMDMLFEFMGFFVEVGVNPKKYVDAIIEERLNKEHRQK